jgi:hypothetical protein
LLIKSERERAYLGFLPMHNIMKSISSAGIMCRKSVYTLLINADLFIKKQIYLIKEVREKERHLKLLQ